MVLSVADSLLIPVQVVGRHLAEDEATLKAIISSYNVILLQNPETAVVQTLTADVQFPTYAIYSYVPVLNSSVFTNLAVHSQWNAKWIILPLSVKEINELNRHLRMFHTTDSEASIPGSEVSSFIYSVLKVRINLANIPLLDGNSLTFVNVLTLRPHEYLQALPGRAVPFFDIIVV